MSAIDRNYIDCFEAWEKTGMMGKDQFISQLRKLKKKDMEEWDRLGEVCRGRV